MDFRNLSFPEVPLIKTIPPGPKSKEYYLAPEKKLLEKVGAYIQPETGEIIRLDFLDLVKNHTNKQISLKVNMGIGSFYE